MIEPVDKLFASFLFTDKQREHLNRVLGDDTVLAKAKERLEAGDMVVLEKKKWWQRVPRAVKVKYNNKY